MSSHNTVFLFSRSYWFALCHYGLVDLFWSFVEKKLHNVYSFSLVFLWFLIFNWWCFLAPSLEQEKKEDSSICCYRRMIQNLYSVPCDSLSPDWVSSTNIIMLRCIHVTACINSSLFFFYCSIVVHCVDTNIFLSIHELMVIWIISN